MAPDGTEMEKGSRLEANAAAARTDHQNEKTIGIKWKWIPWKNTIR